MQSAYAKNFTVYCETQDESESLIMCGNLPELGNWEHSKGIPMTRLENWGWWTTDWDCSNKSPFEFKFVKYSPKDGKYTLEDGKSRTHTPSDSEIEPMVWGVQDVPRNTGKKERFKIMTYNVRYDEPRDKQFQWKFRKDHLIKLVIDERPDVIGFQEPLMDQIHDIAAGLGKDYAWVGCGRDDGAEKGECCPVFWNCAKFQMVESGTFWLSPTPEVVGSDGWGAAYLRVCTWVRLVSKKSGITVFHYNAHLDCGMDRAKREELRLVFARLHAKSLGYPAFVTGDFNVVPGNDLITFFTKLDQSKAVPRPMLDSACICAGKRPITFSGWNYDAPGAPIDYILSKPDCPPIKYKVPAGCGANKFPFSDHRPVVSEYEV